jgi:elongation factor P
MQVVATQIRSGQVIVLRGELYRIMDLTHVTPGKGNALVQSKLRNMRTGLQTEHRFRPSDKVEVAHISTKEMQYLYSDGTNRYFMDLETFEQLPLPEEHIEDGMQYLLPEAVVQVDFYDGQPIGVELPNTVVLEVVQTDPAMKGATAAGGSKPAELETGITVNVPMYIEPGTKIVVDTRTGEYVSRADKG